MGLTKRKTKSMNSFSRYLYKADWNATEADKGNSSTDAEGKVERLCEGGFNMSLYIRAQGTRVYIQLNVYRSDSRVPIKLGWIELEYST